MGITHRILPQNRLLVNEIIRENIRKRTIPKETIIRNNKKDNSDIMTTYRFIGMTFPDTPFGEIIKKP